MKKILCLFFTILLCCVSVAPAFAAGATASAIDYDNTSVVEDLKSVHGDKLSLLYPKISSISSIEVIYVFENGYGTNGIDSSGYGLYVYMYIPSGVKLSSSILHTANIACGWEAGAPNDFENAHLKLLDQSDDGTLAKFKLINISSKNVYKSGNERSYCISSVDVYSGGKNAKANRVAKVFTFYEENGVRKCKTAPLTVVNIDVYQTSYLSGNSAKGANYSNQVNTAYFSIPNDLMDKYGKLYSVKYEYYKYRTNPVFIIDSSKKTSSDEKSGTIYDQLMSDRGLLTDDGWYYSLYDCDYDFWASNANIWTDRYYFRMLYGNSTPPEQYKGVSDGYMHENSYTYLNGFFRLNLLTSVFSATEISDHDKIFVSSGELQNYFFNYNKSYYDGKVRDKYSADLFDLNYFSDADIYHCETVSIDDPSVVLPSYSDKYGWLSAWLNGKEGSSMTYDYIYQLGSNVNDLIGTDEEVSERLLVSPSDVYSIKETYSNAKDSTVFLLRYASSDDYFTSNNLSFFNHFTKSFYKDVGFYSCETVYLDFDIIQFSFMDDFGEITVISVSSSPSDGFTGIQNTNPGSNQTSKNGCHSSNGCNSFNEIIAVVLVCALVLFAINIWSKIKKNKVVVKIQDKNDRN